MRRPGTPLAILLLTGGCRYAALDHASVEAARITNLHWLMFWILGVVFAGVMGALVLGVTRKSRAASAEGDRRRVRGVALSAGLSTVLLLVLLAASVLAGRQVATPPGPEALEVEIVGRQWWWEVRYPSGTPSEEVSTANEIHVPVGRPTRLHFSSGDVIHSFWIPNVQGKKDLIPGRPTTLVFRAEREGVFRGQCAEFCGLQHAHMGLLLVVETPERFDAWLEGQRRLATEPEDPVARHGRAVFLSSPCVMCHTIRGAGSFGHKGPDLTHIASRRMIAAATLPNTAGNLAGWIADPQRLKPGNRMPPNVMAGPDLLGLVSYLESLR